MKKNLLSAAHLLALFILSGVFFFSCKKDHTVSSYYISFKANDTIINYMGLDLIFPSVIHWNQAYNCTLVGSGQNNGIAININDVKPIIATTYGWNDTADNVSPQTYIHFSSNKQTYFSANDGKVWIDVKEITDTSILGTFSGIVRTALRPDINLTDGAFMLPLK